MKKLLFLTLILAVLFSIISFTSAFALDAKYQTVKIGLYYGTSAKSSITVTSDMQFQAGYMDNSVFVPCYAFPASELAISYVSASSLNINGVQYDFPGNNFALLPDSGTLTIDGISYRGGVELASTSPTGYTVINFVDINDYIAAVVGKEMSPSWNIEALKAQAVCARSYTISTWNKHSSYGFNLCGTQDCQAYMGISGETESTIRAAKETEDQVLTYNGTVASALYSSSNGGSSAYSKYVWGNDVPYLQAVEDIYEDPAETSYSPWQVTLTNSQIQEKLASKDIDIGDVYDMKVTGADEFGRTYKVTIYGTKGTYDLKNDSTRTFFGLRSQKYSITSHTVQPLKLYAQASGGGAEITQYSVMTSSGKGTSSSTDVYVMGKDGIFHNQGASSDVAPGTYVLDGKGWGHGLGMSQWGAKAMADRGFGYADILNFYYKGTILE